MDGSDDDPRRGKGVKALDARAHTTAHVYVYGRDSAHPTTTLNG